MARPKIVARKPPGRRPRGRPTKAGRTQSVETDTSESQPTQTTGSSPPSDYSTRPTSGIPTPNGVTNAPKARSSIEIPLLRRATRGLVDDGLSMNTRSKLSDDSDSDDGFSARRRKTRSSARVSSGRALRQSDLSLNPPKIRTEIPDSEDDSDYDPDFALARRLQEEEYARIEDPIRAKDEGKTRGPVPMLSPPTDSLAYASYLGAKVRRRSAKRSLVAIDDSESDEVPPKRPKSGTSSNEEMEDAPPPLGFVKASTLIVISSSEDDGGSEPGAFDLVSELDDLSSDSENFDEMNQLRLVRMAGRNRRGYSSKESQKSRKSKRTVLEEHHPQLKTMWTELEARAVLRPPPAPQPSNIHRQMKPFQLAGLAWMKALEASDYRGGLLGDEMGLGKTIQAVSLIMSDFPARKPSLVLVPPVALMQWVNEINSYTDGTLKTFIFHGTNSQTKNIKLQELKKYDVIIMSYNSLESMYRRQTKGHVKKSKNQDDTHEIRTQPSLMHKVDFHRVILDEAHEIKTRTTSTAKACFALKAQYRWCLSGTPLQNRIGEFFSLLRFLEIKPYASYFCRACPCENLEWNMNEDKFCRDCGHAAASHVSVFNQELLSPIQKFGNAGPGAEAFRKLRLLTDHMMLRRLKKDHTDSMELPVKEIAISRQFFGEVENDFANSIMTNSSRKFETYVAQGVLLNNYANIFGLIMQMRQVADHPDLLLKKNAEGGQNILECSICECPAEDPIASKCHHHFCRTCVRGYLDSLEEPECPRCHVGLSIDLDQPEVEQDQMLLKKASIINRIKMENWTSSTKIELLVHELFKLRSPKATHKSIIFSQFTSMLQLIEWRLRHAGFTTVMLDGTMTPAQRNASINHFMTNVDVEVFLVSLKAGGVALNLTEASRVFLVEPWWNPAVEWQSADRCHRIGQCRPCVITNLVIEDSVESRMVLLQEKKARMIQSTINKDDKAMESLTPEDMQFLFKGS